MLRGVIGGKLFLGQHLSKFKNVHCLVAHLVVRAVDYVELHLQFGRPVPYPAFDFIELPWLFLADWP